ncbi:MAG: bifunctional diaminohydroxyphosphoribosylaminopyrimidine deaminase/5-amino-6-(5-phosphoribosylamino)uracil reductase RibD [Prevotella sp.]|nr:bifunctional diaminohydroxyphosphoribosylaminopyrimidine deaminase/5-amino-6-(5-phosphoribosylamino)uracil reductase RibD [Prevotella sp.]
MQDTDELYMRRCLQLARCGRQNAKPNPMVGAIIVAPLTSHFSPHPSHLTPLTSPLTPLTSRIIGEGYHARCGEGHAEVNAFASVKAEDEALLREATMYVSLEPCSHYGKTPPCADLIIKKGLKRVVVGCIDEFAEVQGRGIKKLQDAGIDVTVGVLEEECRELNRRFFTFHRLHRPYIILKWAQTANGFIDDNGHALSISSPFTQMLSHKLRAEEDAILVGRVTEEREHPQLTVRHWVGPSPKRLVIDRQHPLNLESLYHHNIQSLIVEGGRKTLDSFLAQDLWDEIRVETNTMLTVTGGTRAPHLPANVVVTDTVNYDVNTITTFRKCQLSKDNKR